MTRDELLSRLERMEQEARADAAYSGSLAWKFANDRSLAPTAGSDVAVNGAHTANDALALSEARAALSLCHVTVALVDQVRAECLRFHNREPMATCRDAVDEVGRRHCIICRAADALQCMPAPPTEEN